MDNQPTETSPVIERLDRIIKLLELLVQAHRKEIAAYERTRSPFYAVRIDESDQTPNE